MTASQTPAPTPRLRFDRHELAGAFGDLGTDLPLLVALIATCGMDPASVCITFGAMQILTGLFYGIPMPVQPLKAMAAIMLTQHYPAGILAGGGLVIGVAMLVLALSGSLDWIARVVPREVIRGIQLGLGITLATLALKSYASADGVPGYLLATVAVLAFLALRRQRRVPAPLVILAGGAAYAAALHLDALLPLGLPGLSLPRPVVPTSQDLARGALLLALPQLALSLGNSVLATSQATADLFPDRAVPVRRIGLTYGFLNLLAPWTGGFPVCHGCGGLVGFYNFGARTGGAPVLYGAFYLVLGLFFAPLFGRVVGFFPMPLLGVVLFLEAVALMMLVRDVAGRESAFWITLAVAGAVVGLPYGYVVGLVGGTLVAWSVRRGWLRIPTVGLGAGELAGCAESTGPTT